MPHHYATTPLRHYARQVGMVQHDIVFALSQQAWYYLIVARKDVDESAVLQPVYYKAVVPSGSAKW